MTPDYQHDGAELRYLGNFCANPFPSKRPKKFTSEKLWKSSWNKLLPLKIDGQETLFLDAYAVAWAVDWQNGHLTAGSMYDPKFNKEITGEYSDVESLSQPGSLARVMK